MSWVKMVAICCRVIYDVNFQMCLKRHHTKRQLEKPKQKQPTLTQTLHLLAGLAKHEKQRSYSPVH